MSFIKKFIEQETVSRRNFLLASAFGISGAAAARMFGPSPVQAATYSDPTIAWSYRNRTNPYWNEIVSGGEGIALLHLKSNVYYSLNSVGADIWEFIQSPSSKDEICKYIEEKFQIKKEVCRSDIEKILSEFDKYNLLASP